MDKSKMILLQVRMGMLYLMTLYLIKRIPVILNPFVGNIVEMLMALFEELAL
jgi:hypothetical protein